MKALYKGRLSDVWEISKTNVQPVWVQQAFKQNYLKWNDNKLYGIEVMDKCRNRDIN